MDSQSITVLALTALFSGRYGTNLQIMKTRSLPWNQGYLTQWRESGTSFVAQDDSSPSGTV